MSNHFRQGFTSQPQEITHDALPVTGRLPDWLSGTLVRNGPGQFEAGDRSYRHWFDGLAMLHAFGFAGGRVSYTNRFLRTSPYLADTTSGRIHYRGFAVDPCMTLFQRTFSQYRRAPNGPNAVVNVGRAADQYVAMTELPMMVRFDPHTLETLGVFDYDQPADVHTATAHPHYDPVTGDAFNYLMKFGPKSQYQIHRYRGTKRDVLAKIPVSRPAYMHSFALTPHYVVLAEYPFKQPSLAALMHLAMQGRPFIESFAWLPDQPARFLVIDRADGTLKTALEADPFFAFHHINAYERDNEIVLDIAAYDDASIISGLYLEPLRSEDQFPETTGAFRRYRLPLDGTHAAYEVVVPEGIELPRIFYKQHNGRDYGVAYGISMARDQHDFPNQLVRVDVKQGSATIWREPGTYPSEPVFVPAPDATAEDDGVLLSVVLDSDSDTSFLLVLNAADMRELARAVVPQHVPFNFHGQFWEI